MFTCPSLFQSYEEGVTGSYGTSFPQGFGYGIDGPDGELDTGGTQDKPRILLMGLRRLVLLGDRQRTEESENM